MEGSAPGPAASDSFDPSVNPDHAEPSPLSDVPTGGADGTGAGGAPGPASTSIPGAGPQPQRQAARPAQPQGPVDSIFLTELQEQKKHLAAIRLDNKIQHIVIGLCVVAAITYLTLHARAALPKPPKPPVGV